jgi:hypothetical protein
MSIFLYGYLYGFSIHNVKITCLYGAESPEIVEGRQRNKGQVDWCTPGMSKIPSWSEERNGEGTSEACLPQAGKGSQGAKLRREGMQVLKQLMNTTLLLF